MNSLTSIILEDASVVAEICGPHDRNLKVFEELFGNRVFSRGNEVLLDSRDPEKCQIFSTLIDEMHRYARESGEIHPELIKASFESLSDQGDQLSLLQENVISIPQGYHKVYPRTLNQARFIHGLDNHDMSFGIGPAGTGKTFLAIAHALAEVLSHRKRRLILTRPVVEAGENLGFLPGDLAQKLDPYIRPLYDAISSLVPPEVLQRLEDNRVLEIAPLAYMRGRNLRDAYVILDEAQNATREQLKMFLTRMGENTQAVITGDITQIDLPNPRHSGLLQAQRILGDIPEIHFSYLTGRDVVRSNLVRKIIHAYEHFEEKPRLPKGDLP